MRTGVLVGLVISMAAMWVLIVVQQRELDKSRVVWRDSLQRIERLDNHVEQIEWWLMEEEEKAWEAEKK